mgnify:CR=1 FL=1
MGVLGASGVRGIYAGRRNVLRGLNGVSCDVEGCGRCCGGVCDDGFAGVDNRPARVSEEKRKAIADAAKKLNYVPNQSARSLVTKQSQLVALIVLILRTCFSRRLPSVWRMSAPRRGIR